MRHWLTLSRLMIEFELQPFANWQPNEYIDNNYSLTQYVCHINHENLEKNNIILFLEQGTTCHPWGNSVNGWVGVCLCDTENLTLIVKTMVSLILHPTLEGALKPLHVPYP